MPFRLRTNAKSELISRPRICCHLKKTKDDHLYRIFQEAIRNAIVHGRATEIQVRITADKSHLEMAISDNGVGLSNQEMNAEEAGLGLSSIRERALLLGGRTDFSSEPNMGTTVSVSVPGAWHHAA